MKDLLPEYAAGSLPPTRHRAVEAHLAGCAACRAELASWRAVADALRADQRPGPAGADLVRAALSRSLLAEPADRTERVSRADRTERVSRADRAEPERGEDATNRAVPVRMRRRPRAVWDLLVAEARLVRPSVPVVSALVIALGLVLAMSQRGPGAWAGDVLALVAPVVAAAGIAAVYGSGRDAVAELTAATPTSPRLLLLVRVALVFWYDVTLAAAATGVLVAAGADPDGPLTLTLAWLGPVALLSALSVVLAGWFGADVAIGLTAALWGVRVLGGTSYVDDSWLSRAVQAIWSTSVPTVVVSLALLAVAVIHAVRGEPGRRLPATHLT